MKRLYDIVKSELPEDLPGLISDGEMLCINRRDFMYSETSAVKTFLAAFGQSRVSYEMHAILDYLHSALANLSPGLHVKICQLSNSMTMPGLFSFTVCDQPRRQIGLYAPRGIQELQTQDNFAKELFWKFSDLQQDAPVMQLSKKMPKNTLGIVLCNATDEAEVLSGLRLFGNYQSGLLIIKGYGKFKAPNCGEVAVNQGLNIHCHLAGFGLAIKI